MKRRIFTIVLMILCAVSTIGCETKSPFESHSTSSVREVLEEAMTEETSTTDSGMAMVETEKNNEQADSDDDNGLKELETLGDIETKQKLFDVEFTVPKDFVDEGTSQEELDKKAAEGNYQSATLNEDGSVTYIMSKEQHKKMLKGIEEGIENSLNDMIKSEDYNFTKIDHNNDYTSFTVTTTSEELNWNESLSVLEFYMLGGLYGIFSGDRAENVRVDFVNEATGKVIDTSDSENMGSDSSE